MTSWSAVAFSKLRRKVVAEADSDIEPQIRYTVEWDAWHRRELTRRRKLTELAEAEALTTDPADPAPVASLGLPAFLDWCKRQERRRRARRAA